MAKKDDGHWMERAFGKKKGKFRGRRGGPASQEGDGREN